MSDVFIGPWKIQSSKPMCMYMRVRAAHRDGLYRVGGGRVHDAPHPVARVFIYYIGIYRIYRIYIYIYVFVLRLYIYICIPLSYIYTYVHIHITCAHIQTHILPQGTLCDVCPCVSRRLYRGGYNSCEISKLTPFWFRPVRTLPLYDGGDLLLASGPHCINKLYNSRRYMRTRNSRAVFTLLC